MTNTGQTQSDNSSNDHHPLTEEEQVDFVRLYEEMQEEMDGVLMEMKELERKLIKEKDRDDLKAVMKRIGEA